MKRLQFRAHRTLPRPIASVNVVGLLAVLSPLLVIYLVLVGQPHDAGPRLPPARYASIQPDAFSTEAFRFYGADALFVDGQPIDPTETDEYVRRACAPMMSFIGSGDDAIYIEADPELALRGGFGCLGALPPARWTPRGFRHEAGHHARRGVGASRLTPVELGAPRPNRDLALKAARTERAALARYCLLRLELRMPMLLDDMTHRAF